MKLKIALTLTILALYEMIDWASRIFINNWKSVTLGKMSVAQLSDSDTSFSQAMSMMQLISDSRPWAFVTILFFGFILFIWRKEIKNLFKVALVAVILFSNIGAAQAYYDTRDLPEYVEIMPNQSAFLIPLTGATKENQASFMSETFLNANKVAMKRIQIPHTTLKTGALEQDKFIPASRLLLVDRTPVTREWVSIGQRGTSTKDEGFRFESAESINISTGIVLSAFVREEDAAKFVYWFGTKTATNSEDPSVKFASVMNGRSLAEVVDDNVRRKVQSILAREFGKLSLTDASAKKAEIIAAVEKEAKETFATMGVTISFVGYAEGLSYEPKIQEAINNVYIAQKKADESERLMKTVPYEQAMVNVNFTKAQAEALKTAAGRWSGTVDLPNWVIIPSGLMDTVSGWLGKGQMQAK